MDFRVEITGSAIADLAEIASYIAQDNPAAKPPALYRESE
jgi:plasmid stabilization system protein ParE